VALAPTVASTLVDTFASFRASVREGDVTIPKISAGEPLKTECDHFIECVRGGCIFNRPFAFVGYKFVVWF
jgi:hypothetical protein